MSLDIMRYSSSASRILKFDLKLFESCLVSYLTLGAHEFNWVLLLLWHVA